MTTAVTSSRPPTAPPTAPPMTAPLLLDLTGASVGVGVAVAVAGAICLVGSLVPGVYALANWTLKSRSDHPPVGANTVAAPVGPPPIVCAISFGTLYVVRLGL